MISAASPMAWAPLEHALTMAKLGPLAPRSMATIPAAMSAIIVGTVKGQTRRHPFSWRARVSFSMTSSPPTPEETMTATSSASAAMSNPLSAAASRAATTPSWI